MDDLRLHGLVGAGKRAEGDAAASDVLAGKTFSNDDDVGLTGAMPNRGAVDVTLTTEGQEYTVPAGYHSGLGKVKAAITGLVASVIKAGTTVGGVIGTFTSDATATAGQMLSGVTAYVNGSKVTGTIASKAAATYTPSTTAQTITAGQYLSGNQTIAGDADLISANIKAGKNIFGIDGTYIEQNKVKSIQTFRGYFTNVSSNYTISSVTPENCLVYIDVALSGSTSATVDYLCVRAQITSETTLNLTRVTSGISTYVSVKIIEFENVRKSVSGTAEKTSASSGARAHIHLGELVDRDKVVVSFSFSTSDTGTNHIASMMYDSIISMGGGAYDLKINFNYNLAVGTISYTAIEFY